jgi:hypothetical protein
MTDRFKGFIVTLAKDTREDDAEDTLTALKMVRGVLSVDPIKDNPNDYMIYERVRSELVHKLWEVLKK